jgi:hypothetical protein
MNLTIKSSSSSICRRSDNILLLTRRFFSHHWCCMWSRNFWTVVLSLSFVSIISIYRFQCSTLRDFIIYIIIAFLITTRKFLFICIFSKLRCFHVDWFVRILLIFLRYKMSFVSTFISVVILRMRFFICFSINFSYFKICARNSVSSLLHNDFHSEINNCLFVDAEKIWDCVWFSNDIIDVLINIKIWIWWFKWRRLKWRSKLRRY